LGDHETKFFAMNDFKFACRQLLKNPGFTTVAVLTLGLGIGACTAMFSLINSVLLRPLPFRSADRLVWIENLYPGDLSGRTIRMDNFMDWQSQQHSFEDLAGYYAFFDQNRFVLSGSGDPQRLRGVPVTKNFLPLLGVEPMLGRNFSDEECLLNGRKAVILSHAYWRQQFGGDTHIVGRSIDLNGSPTQIVGVLPASFDFDSIFTPGTKVELLVPLPVDKQLAGQGNILFAIGRLKPKGTLRQTQAEFDVIDQRLTKEHPERYGFGARMSDMETSIRGGFRQPMFMLFAAVGCVLLIACFNLSNLLLARSNARRKEFAVRAALGASRWRLMKQTLTESLVLAGGGCAIGVPLAFAAAAALARLETFNVPLMQSTSVDGTVLAFTLVLGALAGALSGTLPALQLSRGNIQQRMNADSSRGSGGATSALVRQGLVVSEIAMACVLLVGAGLLVESFSKLLDVNLGFQPKHAAAWRLSPTRNFNSLLEANQYFDRLVDRIAAIPGVESIGLSDALPLGRNRSWGVGAKGVSYPKDDYPGAAPRVVDHRYLQTMRIPLLEGRYFEASDTAKSENVIVINETLAKRLWPDRSAVGQMADVNGGSRVIGVVANVRHSKLEDAGSGEVYLNFRQCSDWPSMNLVIRSTRPIASLAPEVRAVSKEFDPMLPTTEYITLEGIVDQAVAPRRLITSLLGAFSSLALLLAAIGLYGVVAYSVVQRTREIGIRMAIGAQRSDIMRLIVGEGFKMAATGVALGLLAALLLARVLNSLLFGVSATDPFIFGTNAAILAFVALAACAAPARRAAKVEPIEALRYE
jgi:predicted permease